MYYSTLARMKKGEHGIIRKIRCRPSAQDPECRLLETGFVEGATIEVMHTGFWGGDPIAVRVGGATRVALRRREALAVLVEIALPYRKGRCHCRRETT